MLFLPSTRSDNDSGFAVMHLAARDWRHVKVHVETIQGVTRSFDEFRIDVGAVELETFADFLDEFLHPGRFPRASLEKDDGKGSHNLHIAIATHAHGQLKRGQSFPVERVYPSPRWSSKRSFST
jgi:hypothetical protein